MLIMTANEEASTPDAPLMPQNQGAGVRSMEDTSAIPVGKPHPIKNPPGAMAVTATAARIASSLPSRSCALADSKPGKTRKYAPTTSAQIASLDVVRNGNPSDTRLPMPVARMSENRTMLNE